MFSYRRLLCILVQKLGRHTGGVFIVLSLGFLDIVGFALYDLRLFSRQRKKLMIAAVES
jgi:hypothetical protein